MKPCNFFCPYLGFVLFCVLTLTACSDSGPVADATIERPEKVVPVTVEIIHPVDLTQTFILPAGLEAWEDLVISAEIAGPVNKINFSEGASVRKGDVLLEIDPETLKRSLERDEENYAVAKRKLKRYRELEVEGLISQQELDEQLNLVTAAEMALKTTRLQLEKCYPQAPISGIVDLHYVSRGEYVDPGKPLIRLVQVDKLNAIAALPEKDVSFLKVGQKVEIIPAEMTGKQPDSLEGTIEHIAFSAEEATRTYRTKIAVDNSSGQLRSGMIVRARFVRQRFHQVLAVPLYAVIERDGEKLVFVEEDNIARKIRVTTGPSVDQRIVIESGLSDGQRLIVKGQQLLIDGAKIAVQEN